MRFIDDYSCTAESLIELVKCHSTIESCEKFELKTDLKYFLGSILYNFCESFLECVYFALLSCLRSFTILSRKQLLAALCQVIPKLFIGNIVIQKEFVPYFSNHIFKNSDLVLLQGILINTKAVYIGCENQSCGSFTGNLLLLINISSEECKDHFIKFIGLNIGAVIVACKVSSDCVEVLIPLYLYF